MILGARLVPNLGTVLVVFMTSICWHSMTLGILLVFLNVLLVSGFKTKPVRDVTVTVRVVMVLLNSNAWNVILTSLWMSQGVSISVVQ